MTNHVKNVVHLQQNSQHIEKLLWKDHPRCEHHDHYTNFIQATSTWPNYSVYYIKYTNNTDMPLEIMPSPIVNIKLYFFRIYINISIRVDLTKEICKFYMLCSSSFSNIFYNQLSLSDENPHTLPYHLHSFIADFPFLVIMQKLAIFKTFYNSK
jgi:hypothetical protein